MRNIQLIAETAWVTVAAVKKRFEELHIEPTVPGESAVGPLVDREKDVPVSKVKKNNEDVPPLTHWDTLAPWQKAVVGAFFWHDGTVFDGIPRKDMHTIARERGTTYPAAYGLLQWALKKLRSIERPTRKKRESKSSETRVVKQKRVLIQSSIRPTHASIPEEQTQTYEDLLAWLRMPENASLVTSFEETVRLAKLKHSAYSPAQLAPKIIEKFREGFLGHAIFSLAYYLKPEALVQDFIREIRPPVHTTPAVKQAPVLPLPAKKSEQPTPQKPVQPPRTPKPFSRRVFTPRTPHHHSGAPFVPLTQAEAPKTQPTHRWFPEFISLDSGIQWLREQSQFQARMQEASKMIDDLAITAFLVKSEPLLLRVLLTLKQDFSQKNIKSILLNAFQEVEEIDTAPVQPVETSPAPEAVVVVNASSEEWSSLHITPEHETAIRALVQLHQDKKYREFWNWCQALAGTHVLAEIQEVKEAFQHRSILESIFFIAEQEITEKEKDMYRQHHWASRIASFPGVASQLQRLLAHEGNKSMKVLKKFLEDVKLYVPLKREWQGLEEKELEATEAQKKEREKENYIAPNLFDVVVSLVRTRKKYEKKDEESTKKLLRVVKQIMWREEITTDDEEIEEPE